MEAISISDPTLARRFVSSAQRVQRYINASRDTNDWNHKGKLVDENMIILRMRMKEMKILETSIHCPENWMGWEKKYFEHYNEDVCEAVGLLQMHLMNTRPCLAMGLMALIMLSVPLSASVVIYNVLGLLNKLLY